MPEDIYDAEEWAERLADKEEREEARGLDMLDAYLQGDYDNE